MEMWKNGEIIFVLYSKEIKCLNLKDKILDDLSHPLFLLVYHIHRIPIECRIVFDRGKLSKVRKYISSQQPDSTCPSCFLKIGKQFSVFSGSEETTILENRDTSHVLSNNKHVFSGFDLFCKHLPTKQISILPLNNGERYYCFHVGGFMQSCFGEFLINKFRTKWKTSFCDHEEISVFLVDLHLLNNNFFKEPGNLQSVPSTVSFILIVLLAYWRIIHVIISQVNSSNYPSGHTTILFSEKQKLDYAKRGVIRFSRKSGLVTVKSRVMDRREFHRILRLGLGSVREWKTGQKDGPITVLTLLQSGTMPK